jgi:UDP-N-acetylmuramate--alanine ligase
MAALAAWQKEHKKALVIKYAEALGMVFSAHQGIAVCGSHGKTTTSAWLGYVLQQAGIDPSVLVGSRVPQFNGSAILGQSPYFVAETDEYQNKLQYFFPQGVLLNNIDYDHPDFFKTKASYYKVFEDFLKKIPAKGFLVANASDALVRKACKSCKGKVITYSLGSHKQASDYVSSAAEMVGDKQVFEVFKKVKDMAAWESLGEFSIKLSGDHNILNALAVIAASQQLGAGLQEIKKGLSSFTGTERRLQTLGEYRGAEIIDDYAHHPTEIKATLSGLRARCQDKKIITIFHPHTFTRTKALLGDFSKSFGAADEVIILNIYGSAREKQGGVSSAELVKLMRIFNKENKIKQSVKNLAGIDEAAAYLKASLDSNKVALLMGAGDVFRVGEKLLGKK